MLRDEEGNVMMRSARRVSLLVAFSLVTSTATAYAECAWVLWSKEVVSKSARWSIERAASTEAECKAEGHKALVFWTRHQPLAHVDTDDVSVSLTAKPGSTVSIYYRCLPDTVDPRGLKEGARWVLWTHTTEPGLRGWWSGATWKPHAAYSSKSECEDPLGIRLKPGNDPLGIRNPQDANLKCLPETVDPRGPKGK